MHRENPGSHNGLIQQVVNERIRAARPAMHGVVCDPGPLRVARAAASRAARRAVR